jgi:hypothetical protein
LLLAELVAREEATVLVTAVAAALAAQEVTEMAELAVHRETVALED